MSRGDAEYWALQNALQDNAPPCSNDERFILDATDYAPGEPEHLGRTICRLCPTRNLCKAYADAAKPTAGVWAGRTYPRTERRRRH